ncbi:hypothetical protein BNJ_00296 [Kaumoebavirus]|uniref:hypothetical protein n=1 Tax=Kaumoebavirus TaxID=1859492 RepID=UPI0009C38E95|nr:hypothetical protein BNJ_00296 [Kaumoebavirus]ARA72118.1 hypothetical protein BNJ_00296 [Kaumoebavirus]
MIVRSGNKETCRIVWIEEGKVVRGTLKEFLEDSPDHCFLLHLLQLEEKALKSVLWRAKCWEGRNYELMRGDDQRQFVAWLAFKSISEPAALPTTSSVFYYAQLPFSVIGATYSYFFPDQITLRENYLTMIEKEFPKMPEDFTYI